MTRSALALLAALGCASSPRASPTPCLPAAAEVTPTPIALRDVEAARGGRTHARYAELSALAWHGDDLWLIPQFAERFAAEGRAGAWLRVPRARIEAYLDGRDPAPIAPERVDVDLGDARGAPGYEGVEAVAVEGDRVWAAVEVSASPERAGAFVIAGRVGPEGVRFGGERLALEPVVPLPNMGYEALLGTPDGLLAIFESNGHTVPGDPYALRLSRDLQGAPARVPFPRLDYRVTDVTPLDARGRFWAVNYFFPGEHFLQAGGASFVDTVERLVELQWSPTGVTRTGRAPVALRRGTRPRNWEGVARLSARQLLVVTDMWPDTILAMVPVE